MARVIAIGLFCLFVVATLALVWTYHDLQSVNERAADLVSKQLQIQLFRIKSHIGVAWQFPDWDPVAEFVQIRGQCIKYVAADGTVGRSSCVGSDRDSDDLPAWLVSIGSSLLEKRTDVERPLVYQGTSHGTIIVTTESQVVLSAIWRQASGLLGLTAMVVLAICGLLHIAIGRALRPAKDILAGLERLADGDLSCRLPNFRLIELQRISEVFNILVTSLEQTTSERAALATRLVDGQEQERRHLARELHDELAQTLSAMNAIATSIRVTAETDCPALVPEATRLAQTSMSVMKSLRATLQNLRPPEIDDFGLTTSLAILTREQERTKDVKVMLKIDESVQELPPTAAAHVYRIVQEGLTNIGKHARGSRAQILLEVHKAKGQDPRERRKLEITIKNDRCDPALSGSKMQSHGLGLIGIHERVTALGGQLDVFDLGKQGFMLRAVIPFETPSVCAMVDL